MKTKMSKAQQEWNDMFPVPTFEEHFRTLTDKERKWVHSFALSLVKFKIMPNGKPKFDGINLGLESLAESIVEDLMRPDDEDLLPART